MKHIQISKNISTDKVTTGDVTEWMEYPPQIVTALLDDVNSVEKFREVDYTNKNDRSNSFDIMGSQLGEIQRKHGDSVFKKYYNKWFDISIFKNNSIAECTEYAALTQNLFSFTSLRQF